jgi:hypothetical protein
MIVAIAVPTIIRFVVAHEVSGVAFSPYVPFVLLTAVMLKWTHAAAVALISAAVADLLFVEPLFELLAGPTDAFGIAIFLASSALMIILVRASRFIVHARPKPVPSGETETGIIFSLEKGQAWASWSDSGRPLRLGPESEVAEMMKDFLAQIELGKRLAERHS